MFQNATEKISLLPKHSAQKVTGSPEIQTISIMPGERHCRVKRNIMWYEKKGDNEQQILPPEIY